MASPLSAAVIKPAEEQSGSSGEGCNESQRNLITEVYVL